MRLLLFWLGMLVLSHAFTADADTLLPNVVARQIAMLPSYGRATGISFTYGSTSIAVDNCPVCSSAPEPLQRQLQAPYQQLFTVVTATAGHNSGSFFGRNGIVSDALFQIVGSRGDLYFPLSSLKIELVGCFKSQ